MAIEGWNWRFFGIEWSSTGRPVQEWFDSLPDDAKDEVRDTIGYLQQLPIVAWKKPKFDRLGGEEICEVRLETQSHTYRIYGYHGPSSRGRQVFTFLLGCDKKRGNDTDGKREATKRKRYIEAEMATVHEFKFS